MISRDMRQARTVDAFSNASFDASCGDVAQTTSTEYAGRIIDRYGMGAAYTSALVSVAATYTGASSTVGDGAAGFTAVRAFLYHSSTTCADDFDRYSSDSEQAAAPLFLTGNTTSTLASGYQATSTAGTGTFGTYTATATGGAAGSYWAAYEITGAQRYIRVFPSVETHASSSGGPDVHANAQITFGNADAAPPTTTSTTPLYRT